MSEKQFFKVRLWLSASVSVAIWGLLAWNFYHGGIPRHHLLADKDLPAISNVWGALLIPVLTWFLTYLIQNRAFGKANETRRVLRAELYGLAAALLFGAILSAFFTFGYPDICGYMLLGLLASSLFFPLYRPGCFLGFVLGMTFTFGAVLPAIIGTVLGLSAFLIYRYIRAGLLYLSFRSGLVSKSPF
jgi:hypothetical protein